MSDNKSYRIKANVGQDSVLNVNLNQDFKTLEVLSLKFDSENLYKFHTSNYGCVAGRVLANGNFGIPNAKISIFIKATDEDLSDAILSYLYPYKNTRTKNDDGIRYNLLPDQQLSDCHRNVGTFPNKRLVLDDNNVFEVYDKYYKYTTRSNEAGDYMIFGVPVGEQTIHVDIDLSDIGILSQRPRDMVYKGYNVTQFENANMFKSSTELDSLTQIISQNSNVYVYPFWGEKTEGDIAITRKDIEIQYTFEPTCVFMGSIITDEKSNAISKTCVPSERMGKMDRLTTGNGTIEMIRKTPDGRVEEKIIQGNQLIDGNGVWCYQIPMNLDYVRTDEYGNIVPTDDPKKGIPTRTRVRFRMSITEFETGGQFSHAAKTLVPNNPQKEEDLDYVFGTNTLDDEFATKSFRDLFWNQVYTVKSYIPRFQQGNYNRNKRFSGIKEINVNGGNNPLPYNNMRIDISFIFGLQCAIFHILLWIVGIYNRFMYHLWNALSELDFWPVRAIGNWANNRSKCLYIGDSFCPDLEGWYFAPKCPSSSRPFDNAWKAIKDKTEDGDKPVDIESTEYKNSDETEKSCLTNNIKYFTQCVEINLAMEYDVIQFDFYNDWINGVVYSPRWNADIRKKRSYLFGLIKISPRLNACSEENFSNTRRMVQQCSLLYSYDNSTSGYTKNATANGCVDGSNRQRCHKAKGRKYVRVFGSNGGVVHRELSSNDQSIYYYKPCEWSSNRKYPFFATDIVLLGSLTENDGQGIPQTFKKLQSSTYQLPDALASTNIGAEGFLYGSAEGGHVCNKKLGDEGVIIHKVEGTFEGLVNWSRGTDEYEADPYDDDKPITEASGIDWGFVGPEQGENDIEQLYYPGGHFLGISCFNSEANIKSCVNLSRVCELGSTVSHRQSFVVRDGDTYKFIYSIPSGLVSGDELLDKTGRNEFATLNFNRLKTRHNVENGLMEYDFKTIYPINFDGNLKEKLGENYRRAIAENSFARTIEDNSRDYYRFRMGIDEESERTLKNKYLINYNNVVSMPVYENSFYFYFGIKNGNTAFDKFNKEFTAECPKMNDYEPEVKITFDEGNACEEDIRSGAPTNIYIYTKNVENPKCRINGGAYNDKIFNAVINGVLTIPVYTGIEYSLIVWGDNINSVSRQLKINVAIPESLYGMTYTVKDFTDGVYYEEDKFKDECNTAITGYISFSSSENASAIFIEHNLRHHFIKGDEETYGVPAELYRRTMEIDYGTVQGDVNKCYLWEGNADYNIYVRVACNSGLTQWIKYDTIHINMEGLDVMFSENTKATYVKAIKNWLEGRQDNVIDEIVDEESIDSSARLSIKKSLLFRTSKYEVTNSDGIDIEIINPVLEPTLNGSEETIESAENESILKYGAPKNIPLNTLEYFYLPTLFLPTSKSVSAIMSNNYINRQITVVNSPYYNDYSIMKVSTGGGDTKPPYELSCLTQTNPDIGIKFKMNSIYMPYFFRALIITTYEGSCTVSLGIANALKVQERSQYSAVKLNGEDLRGSGPGGIASEYVPIGDFKEIYEEIKDSYALEDAYPVDTIKERTINTVSEKTTGYTIEIKDTEDDDSLIKTVTPTFIGDEDSYGNLKLINPDFETNIRYYLVDSDFLQENYRAYYYDTDNGDHVGSGKHNITDKRKFMVSKRMGIREEFSAPYFPGWKLMTVQYPSGGGGSPAIFYGDDYDAYSSWPKYGDPDNPREEKGTMWSSNALLNGKTPINLHEKVSGGNNKKIIGVYDVDYCRETPRIGDPHGSKIIVIKVYDNVDKFNELMESIGLISRE